VRKRQCRRMQTSVHSGPCCRRKCALATSRATHMRSRQTREDTHQQRMRCTRSCLSIKNSRRFHWRSFCTFLGCCLLDIGPWAWCNRHPFPCSRRRLFRDLPNAQTHARGCNSSMHCHRTRSTTNQTGARLFTQVILWPWTRSVGAATRTHL